MQKFRQVENINLKCLPHSFALRLYWYIVEVRRTCANINSATLHFIGPLYLCYGLVVLSPFLHAGYTNCCELA